MPTRIAVDISTTNNAIVLASFENIIIPTRVLVASLSGSGVFGSGDSHTVQLRGEIDAGYSGIQLTGDSSKVYVGSAGSITADYQAVTLIGDASRLINYGDISSNTSAAVFLSGPNGAAPGTGGGTLLSVQNFGTISGDVGIHSFNTATSIFNSGTISAYSDFAIIIEVGSGTVHNTGTITGAILFEGQSDTLINRGTITGSIDMGFGDDMLDNRSGTITGYISLGNGNDTFRPGMRGETVDGGDGQDSLDFRGEAAIKLTLNYAGVAIGPRGETFYNFESAFGSNFNDTLTGDKVANSLGGGGGDDRLDGRAGNDSIGGGGGDDWIKGGAGKDTLSGGLGTDTFVYDDAAFAGPAASNRDLIKDFTPSDGDRIDLALVDASTLVAGDQAFTFIGANAFHSVAGELRYEIGTKLLTISGDTNGDGVADFFIDLQLAKVSLITALHETDFVL